MRRVCKAYLNMTILYMDVRLVISYTMYLYSACMHDLVYLFIQRVDFDRGHLLHSSTLFLFKIWLRISINKQSPKSV